MAELQAQIDSRDYTSISVLEYRRLYLPLSPDYSLLLLASHPSTVSSAKRWSGEHESTQRRGICDTWLTIMLDHF